MPLNTINHPAFQAVDMTGYIVIKERKAADLQIVKSFTPEQPVDEMAFTWEEVQPTAGGITPKVTGLRSPLLNKNITVLHGAITEVFREKIELDPRRLGGKNIATVVAQKLDILFERLKWREIFEIMTAIKAAGAANPTLTPAAAWSAYTTAKPLKDMKVAKNTAIRAGVMPDTIVISDTASEHLTEIESVRNVLSDSAKDGLIATGAIGKYAGMDIFPMSAQIIADSGAVALMDNSMLCFKRGLDLGAEHVSKAYSPKSKQEEMDGQAILIEIEKHFAIKLFRPWGVIKTTGLYS